MIKVSDEFKKKIDEEIPPPTYYGKWRAIYFEPKHFSGEKICIAVMALGDDGDFKVVQSLRKDLIPIIFPWKQGDFQGCIDWTIECAEKHIKHWGDLDCFYPPLSRTNVGETMRAAGDSIDDIVKAACSWSSSLCDSELRWD